MKLWDISIRQPVFMTMILIAGVVLGTISYFTMPVDLFPDVDFPVVVVTTVYPGASPEEVESQITSKMEEDLSAVSGLDEINSISAESVSTVILVFNLDASAVQAAQDVREQVDLLRNSLPADAQDPVVRRFNPTQAPIMLLAVADRTGATSPVDLRAQVEDYVQKPLLRVDGVSEVQVNGGDVREVRVEVNKDAMDARRVTVQEVAQALQLRNVTVPGGSVVEDDTELLIRTPGEYVSVDEINDTVVRPGTPPIYVRDVATVVDDFETRDVISRLNGKESIVLSVRKATDVNTLGHSPNARLVVTMIEVRS